jgi:transposase
MQVYKVSRKERFEQMDKPYAITLPAESFKIREIKIGVKVGPDYHIQYRKHFYSVPFILIGKRLEVHLAGDILQIYCEHERVASYQIGPANYTCTTTDSHMPSQHQFIKGLNRSKLIFMAGKIGPYTSTLIKQSLDNRKHPEQGYRRCLGILNLARQYLDERVEMACARALHFNMIKPRDVHSILKKGLDTEPLEDNDELINSTQVIHKNIRGKQYYQ